MEENNVSSIFDELAVEQPFFEYATTGQRFANFIIDVTIYYAFNVIVAYILAYSMVISGKDPEEIRALFKNTLFVYTLALANYFVIYSFVESVSKGRSLGKLITRTKVVTNDLQPIGWKEGMIRTLCRMIPFEPFSMLNGVAWHDSMSKTIVIKKQHHF